MRRLAIADGASATRRGRLLILGTGLPLAYADTETPNADASQDNRDRANDERDIKRDQADIRADQKDLKRDQADLRADRQDLRADRQDLRNDRLDMRNDRGDLRSDRQDLRADNNVGNHTANQRTLGEASQAGPRAQTVVDQRNEVRDIHAGTSARRSDTIGTSGRHPDMTAAVLAKSSAGTNGKPPTPQHTHAWYHIWW